MEWSIVKIGSKQFDALHAYGLGILLATATDQTILLRDAGCSYRLSSPVRELPRVNCNTLLENALPFPTEEDLRTIDEPGTGEQKLPVTVFDGLLAALFTTPGPRVLSVSDLLERRRLDEKVVRQALHKVAKNINRWKTLIGRQVYGKEMDWLVDVLRVYDQTHLAFPILTKGNASRDINVLIPIDPSFGYSVRSVRSDGRMTEKAQVAVQGTRYGGLLAFVGASRFLRAQRVADELVNCYIPIAEELSITADTSLPLLLSTDESPDQAVLRRWLVDSYQNTSMGRVWSALAYQMLLTQGHKQSLSMESGVLESGWLLSLQEHLGPGVIAFWRALLSSQGVPDVQEPLRDCLKRRSADAWVDHLRTLAQRLHRDTEGKRRRYSLEEVKRITETMLDAEHAPLKQVLEREHGTLRFGRALRQIGRRNPSRLRDLLEELEEAQTLAQLLPVLHRVIVASELEKAKEPRIIVPDEDDMVALLEDIDQFGVPVLVGLLQVLSALHYPLRDPTPTDDKKRSDVGEKESSPSSYELFIDDLDTTGALPEEDEEP